ncbi:MarR family transcriptional regulator [Deinococcus phoenicis]|uniref:MarR family transcriptional regulator n=1 Tax=Deinococcus phoenicis TaxID=1476583 RepID=A0A016QMT3_9DEIO|nr:MarR family transcriptional regulator [Deinococcus phoenicis]EYB67311.1 MarR family transcriptional regulator [Deinococcus phoenicis]
MIPGPLPPPTQEQVGRFLASMWHFNRRLKQELDPLLASKHGIDSRKFFILRSIQEGHQYPKVLAEQLQIPATLLSRYLDQLVKQGLIERHIDEQDSRRTRLTVTEAGAHATADTLDTVQSLTGARLARLDPRTLPTLLDALELLTHEDHT